jgi:uncharacterized membrane protein (UPF0127 family)
MAKQNPVFNPKAIIAIILLMAFAGTYIVSFLNHKKLSDRENTAVDTIHVKQPGPVPTEPRFVKQGELNFLSGKDRRQIKKIAIEIADNDAKREQGLMYRKTMADTNGMLFLFAVSEPQNFWMHNTYIPLDIIYIDENRQIVTIARNCKPLNDTDIPSVKSAQYVVEVNGGFCDQYGVKEGDYVSF